MSFNILRSDRLRGVFNYIFSILNNASLNCNGHKRLAGTHSSEGLDLNCMS
jgi:hypothetical protein